MIHSSACEYAIRAMCYLADQAEGTRTLARDVAAREDIPGPFLGKVFQTLVKAGLLRSSKGPGGGFSLAHKAEEISLYDITAVVDGVSFLEGCAVGLEECSDETPCPLHERWKPIRERIKSYLLATSLSDMAAAKRRKRELIENKEKR